MYKFLTFRICTFLSLEEGVSSSWVDSHKPGCPLIPRDILSYPQCKPTPPGFIVDSIVTFYICGSSSFLFFFVMSIYYLYFILIAFLHNLSLSGFLLTSLVNFCKAHYSTPTERHLLVNWKRRNWYCAQKNDKGEFRHFTWRIIFCWYWENYSTDSNTRKRGKPLTNTDDVSNKRGTEKTEGEGRGGESAESLESGPHRTRAGRQRGRWTVRDGRTWVLLLTCAAYSAHVFKKQTYHLTPSLSLSHCSIHGTGSRHVIIAETYAYHMAHLLLPWTIFLFR